MSVLPKTLRYTTVLLPPKWFRIITKAYADKNGPTKTFSHNGHDCWWLDDWTIVKNEEY